MESEHHQNDLNDQLALWDKMIKSIDFPSQDVNSSENKENSNQLGNDNEILKKKKNKTQEDLLGLREFNQVKKLPIKIQTRSRNDKMFSKLKRELEDASYLDTGRDNSLIQEHTQLDQCNSVEKIIGLQDEDTVNTICTQTGRANKFRKTRGRCMVNMKQNRVAIKNEGSFLENTQNKRRCIKNEHSIMNNYDGMGSEIPIMNTQVRTEWIKTESGKYALQKVPTKFEATFLNNQTMDPNEPKELQFKKLISNAHQIVRENQNLSQNYDRLVPKITGFIKETDITAKNMISSIEQKQSSFSSQFGNIEVEKQINEFIKTQMKNLGIIKAQINQFNSFLESISQFKIQKVQVDLQVTYTAQVYPTQLQCYEKLLSQLNDNLFALKRDNMDRTEIIDFKYENGECLSQSVFSAESVFFVALHQDRIICDKRVYSALDFSLIQDDLYLPKFPTTGCITYNETDFIVLSHDGYGKLSLWKWQGKRYDTHLVKITFSKIKECVILNLKKFTLRTPTSIAYVTKDHVISIIDVDFDNFVHSKHEKHYIKVAHIKDYTFVNSKTLLFYSKLGVSLFDLTQERQIQIIQRCNLEYLILAPRFSLDYSPYIISQNEAKEFVLIDLNDQGIKGKIYGMDPSVEIIGVIEGAPEDESRIVMGIDKGNGGIESFNRRVNIYKITRDQQ